MNSRQKRLVQELLRQRSMMTVRSLAEVLECSERTVQYDIGTVNRDFENLNLNARIRGKRGQGIKLSLDQGELSVIEGLVQGGTVSGYSELERFVRGVLAISCSEGCSCKTKALSKTLYITERQLKNDVRRWNQLFAFFGCSIEIGRMVELVGDEFNVRLAVLLLLSSFVPVSMRREIELQFSRDALLVNRVTGVLEKWQGFPFSENARHSVFFILGLTLSRIRGGHAVFFGSEGSALSFTPDISDRISRDIEKGTGTPFNYQEMELLRRIALCGTRRFDAPFGSGCVEADGEARFLAADLIGRMEKWAFPEAFEEVRSALVMIVDQAIRRRKLSAPVPFRDPFTVKVSNMLWYATVMWELWRFDAMAGLKPYAADIDRIALLLLSGLERLPSGGKCRAALVVNCGVEQVYYARFRLCRLVPDMEITAVLSDSSLKKDPSLKRRGIDLVIAFEHVVASAPVCQISFAVDEDDVRKVGSFVADWRRGVRRGDPDELACSFETVSLCASSLRELPCAIWKQATSEEVLDVPEELFDYAFNVSCVICGGMGVAVLPLPGVRRTAGRLYLTPAFFIGKTISKFAVLFVAESDRLRLPLIIAQFKDHMGVPRTCDTSWELPPAVDCLAAME